MTSLYAYSLIPVLSVSVLLFTSAVLYARSMPGLTLYCAAIAVWSAALLMFAFPELTGIAKHFAQTGAFVSAAFIHAAYDFTHQRQYLLVWFGYGVAAAITLVGVGWPGLLYSPATLAAGPAFWPTQILAIGATLLPLWRIATAYPNADGPTKRQLRILAISGTVGFSGAWVNAVALTHGVVVPYPMLMVLVSLLLLTGLLRHTQQAAGQRLLERSLLYAAMTALLSAGFLFGVLLLMNQTAEPLLGQYRLGALFLLFMAALAFEPLRLHIQQLVSRWLLPSHAGSQALAGALAHQEQRAEHAERLAELGTFVSAIAHEVRNPLGVIAANVRLLEMQGANPDVCSAVRNQVERAGTFIDELLRYGRPRPLELRLIDVAATLKLAQSTATSAQPDLAKAAGRVEWQGLGELDHIMLEADQGQLTQLFVIICDNALRALEGREIQVCRVSAVVQDKTLHIRVEDNGPGIPASLQDRLFEPFVTGRKRENGQGGTGLGLAIAKSIAERHHGSVGAGRSELGGACFQVSLPLVQPLVAFQPEPGSI